MAKKLTPVQNMYNAFVKSKWYWPRLKPQKSIEQANARLIASAPETAKQRDALLAACELTEKRLLTHGEWDDNCFYYAGHSASELEEPLRKLKAAIAAAGEK